MDERGKLTRLDYLVRFYSALAVVPDYYGYSDWLEIETVIYNDLVEEAKGRAIDKPVSAGKAVLDMLKEEHNRVIKVRKERPKK